MLYNRLYHRNTHLLVDFYQMQKITVINLSSSVPTQRINAEAETESNAVLKDLVEEIY